jgi:hypothetical protein
LSFNLEIIPTLETDFGFTSTFELPFDDFLAEESPRLSLFYDLFKEFALPVFTFLEIC